MLVAGEKSRLYSDGPLAATSVAGIGRQLGGNHAYCADGPCLDGITAPSGDLLVAFQATQDVCSQVESFDVESTGPTTLRITTLVSPSSRCRGGGGAAARTGDTVLAIAMSQLPSVSRLTVTAGYDQKSTTVDLESASAG